MQCATIEFARNMLGWKDANSTEFDRETQHPVIALMDEQRGVNQRGGTMRLGAYPCEIAPESLARTAYGQEHDRASGTATATSSTPQYRGDFEGVGYRITGSSPDGKLAEIIELPGHPWFLAVQFHPEFKSKPTAAHPFFRDFVGAAIAFKDSSRMDVEPRPVA